MQLASRSQVSKSLEVVINVDAWRKFCIKEQTPGDGKWLHVLLPRIKDDDATQTYGQLHVSMWAEAL